jgi:hypothetical protein
MTYAVPPDEFPEVIPVISPLLSPEFPPNPDLDPSLAPPVWDTTPYSHYWSDRDQFSPDVFSQNIQPKSQWFDFGFSIAFLLNLLLSIVVSSFLIGTAKFANDTILNQETTAPTPSISVNPTSIFLVLFTGLAVAAVVTTLHFVYVFSAPLSYIRYGLLGSMAISIVSSIVPAIATGNLFTLFFPLLPIIFCIVWYCIVRNRIPYSAAILQKSVGIIRDHPAIIGVAVFQSIVDFLVTVLYAFAMFFCQVHNASGLYVYLIFSYTWTINTFDYVVYVTGAGLGARDYFLRGTAFWPKYPVWDSFKLASTKSLGSSACAALLLAVIRTLRAMIKLSEGRDRENERNGVMTVLRCLTLCLLNLLERIARFMSRYALIYCGVFGVPYQEGCRRWLELSTKKWLDVLISGNLIDTALGFNGFVFVIGSGLIGWGVGELGFSGRQIEVIFAVIASVIFCWVVFALLKQPVIVMSDTLLLCWAEDPERLSETNPGLHETILAAYENRPKE